MLKLDPQGAFAWQGGVAGATAYGLTTDHAGNLYVTGGYTGTADFNFSPRRRLTLTSAGDQDAFLARYSATGAVAWARSVGGGESDAGVAVAVTADGTVHALGQFAARAYFNPGRSRFKLTTPAAFATFLAAFSPAGTFADARQIAPYANQLNPPPTGGLFVAGLLQTPGDVDPGPGVLVLEPTVSGKADLFLIRLD